MTATGGKGVAVRATPAATGTLLGRKAEGASLTITCQVKGTMVRDTTQKRSSALWDKLSSGGYVANIYTTAYEATTTGYSAGLKACSPVKSSATTTKTTTIATTVAANGVVDNTAIAEATRTTQPGTVTAKTTVTSTN